MGRQIRRGSVLAGLVAVASCGSPTESPTGQLEPASILWAIDWANHGDARDVRVAVRTDVAELPSGIAEFRVLLIDVANDQNFDEVEARVAPTSSYVTISGPDRSGAASVVEFPQGTTTTAGGTVQNGSTYAIRILTVGPGADGPVVLSPSTSVTLAHASVVRTITEIGAGTGGLDLDPSGNVYVADFGATLDGPPGTSVFRVTPDGNVTRWATGLVGASGNAFGSTGDLFQSNISAGTVSRIEPSGSVSAFAQGLQGGPVGIAVAPGDTLYVVNCGRNRIHKLDPDGQGSVWVSDPLFRCPNGITLASDGNFYVANFDDGAVLRVTPDRVVSRLATLPGGNNGHLLFGNGVLYVAARGAHQIYEVTLDGVVSLLAGTGSRGQLDGTATEATLSLTNDLTLSSDGRILYFNDVGAVSGNPRTISPTRLRAIFLVDS